MRRAICSTTLVNLPIRSVEVPATYAGLNIPIEVAHVTVGAIQGGVNMVAAVTPATVARMSDDASDRFAAQALDSMGTVGQIERQIGDAHPRYVVSMLATSLTGDTPLARANGLVAVGRYNAALVILDAELAKDPGDIPARRCRLQALAGRGLFRLAEARAGNHCHAGRRSRHRRPAAQVAPGSRRSDFARKHPARPAGKALVAVCQRSHQSGRREQLRWRDRNLRPRAGAHATRQRRFWHAAPNGKWPTAMPRGQWPISRKRSTCRPSRANRCWLAQACERMGRLDDALRDANRALQLDPSLSEAYDVRIEVALLGKDADLKAAYRDTRTVQALTPNDPMVYVYRARSRARRRPRRRAGRGRSGRQARARNGRGLQRPRPPVGRAGAQG